MHACMHTCIMHVFSERLTTVVVFYMSIDTKSDFDSQVKNTFHFYLYFHSLSQYSNLKTTFTEDSSL